MGPAVAGVTVVVPVYNPGPYFQRTLDSLFRQTLARTRYEIVFVDDGSTDGTGHRLDRLAAAHPGFVRVEHTPNSGWPGRPRNLGTDLAGNDYVFYCDADDWLPDHALETLLQRIVTDRSDLVASRYIGNRRGAALGLFERGDYCTNWRETPAVFTNLLSQKMFRRDFLRDSGVRFPEGRVRLEDFLFMTEAYLKAERISVHGSRPCYVLEKRDDRGNLTATGDLDGFFRSLGRIIDIIEANTAEGPERDIALDRVIRGELIPSASRPAFLRRDPAERVEVLERVRALLRERVPASAVARLDPASRRRAAAIRNGDRAHIEAWTPWDAAVELRSRLVDASWQAGRLRLQLDVAFVRGGEVVRLRRDAERLSTPPPPNPPPAAYLEADAFDVAAELPRAAAYITLRGRDITDAWRTRAALVLEPDPDAGDDVALHWTATAGIDFATLAEGHPLHAGVWDVSIRLDACSFSGEHHIRADDAAEPVPALSGPVAISPYWSEQGTLFVDVDQWQTPLPGELARRGLGPVVVAGRALTVDLPLVLLGAPVPIEVHLLPTGPARRAPAIIAATISALSATSARLHARLPRRRRSAGQEIRLRLGGPGSGPPVAIGLDLPPAGTATPGGTGSTTRGARQ